MAIDARALAELLELATKGGDVALRWQAFADKLAYCGFDQVNYGIFDPAAADRDTADVLFLSSMRSDWIDHYGRERMDLADPHVMRVRDNRLSPYIFATRDAEKIAPGVSRDVMFQAQDAGLVTHLQVILPGRRGYVPVGGMAIGSTLREGEFRPLIGGDEAVLVLLANLFHQNAIGPLSRIRAGIRPLSPRERDCLQFLAGGARPDRIAHRLGITRSTVDLHLRRARTKLRVATLTQAVAHAIAYDEISVDLTRI